MHLSKQSSTYVPITKDELEQWLDFNRSMFSGPWKLKKGTAGVYLCPLSDTVAIAVSSTIGTRQESVGYANASMSLRLESLVTGKNLNGKAQGQTHFKRTMNWRDTWRKGLDRVRDAYVKSAGFYDALAKIENREKYQANLLDKISAIPGWQSDRFLVDIESKVREGGILTVKQEAVIDRRFAEVKSAPTPAPAPSPSAPSDVPPMAPSNVSKSQAMDAWDRKVEIHFIDESQGIDDYLSILRDIWSWVKARGTPEQLKTVETWGKKLKASRGFSDFDEMQQQIGTIIVLTKYRG